MLSARRLLPNAVQDAARQNCIADRALALTVRLAADLQKPVLLEVRRVSVREVAKY